MNENDIQQELQSVRAEMEAVKAELQAIGNRRDEQASSPRTEMYAERMLEEMVQIRQTLDAILGTMEQR